MIPNKGNHVKYGEKLAEKSRKIKWKQDPEAVKADILLVAVEHFANLGLSGARIDEIAKQTATSKRMIYYYFGDKVGLYRAALEWVYQSVRAGEADLDIDGLDPVESMRKLVQYTFDHHRNNPHFVRLISIENIHNAKYLEPSKMLRDRNLKAVDQIAQIYQRGVDSGVFRAGLQPIELHWAISAMCFYNVSNQFTFQIGFGKDVHSPKGQETLRETVADLFLHSIAAPA